ncbi:MAG: thiamine phosphate synthase [Vicinamibacteria bacterium]
MRSLLKSGEPLLMAILGSDSAGSAAKALDGGADLIQVRAKELSTQNLVRLVLEVVAKTRRPERIIVNGRPDVAMLAGCGGVHLPESGLNPRQVREAYPHLVVGVSRHDRPGLEAADRDGADYVLLGTVGRSPGKEDSWMGLKKASGLLSGLTLPVLAVGGVDLELAAHLKLAGFRGGAAMRPFRHEREAEAAAWPLKMALNPALKDDFS